MPDDSAELLAYLGRLQLLTAYIDPTADTPQATAIRDAGRVSTPYR